MKELCSRERCDLEGRSRVLPFIPLADRKEMPTGVGNGWANAGMLRESAERRFQEAKKETLSRRKRLEQRAAELERQREREQYEALAERKRRLSQQVSYLRNPSAPTGSRNPAHSRKRSAAVPQPSRPPKWSNQPSEGVRRFMQQKRAEAAQQSNAHVDALPQHEINAPAHLQQLQKQTQKQDAADSSSPPLPSPFVARTCRGHWHETKADAAQRLGEMLDDERSSPWWAHVVPDSSDETQHSQMQQHLHVSHKQRHCQGAHADSTKTVTTSEIHSTGYSEAAKDVPWWMKVADRDSLSSRACSTDTSAGAYGSNKALQDAQYRKEGNTHDSHDEDAVNATDEAGEQQTSGSGFETWNEQRSTVKSSKSNAEATGPAAQQAGGTTNVQADYAIQRRQCEQLEEVPEISEEPATAPRTVRRRGYPSIVDGAGSSYEERAVMASIDRLTNELNHDAQSRSKERIPSTVELAPGRTRAAERTKQSRVRRSVEEQKVMQSLNRLDGELANYAEAFHGESTNPAETSGADPAAQRAVEASGNQGQLEQRPQDEQALSKAVTGQQICQADTAETYMKGSEHHEREYTDDVVCKHGVHRQTDAGLGSAVSKRPSVHNNQEQALSEAPTADVGSTVDGMTDAWEDVDDDVVASGRPSSPGSTATVVPSEAGAESVASGGAPASEPPTGSVCGTATATAVARSLAVGPPRAAAPVRAAERQSRRLRELQARAKKRRAQAGTQAVAGTALPANAPREAAEEAQKSSSSGEVRCYRPDLLFG